MNKDEIAMNGGNTKKICKITCVRRSGKFCRTKVCDIQTCAIPNDNLDRSLIFGMQRHVLKFWCDIMRYPRVKHPSIIGRLSHDSAVSLGQYMTKLVAFNHSVFMEATEMASFAWGAVLLSKINRRVGSGLGLKRATRRARPRVGLLLVMLLGGMIIVPTLKDISYNNRSIRRCSRHFK